MPSRTEATRAKAALCATGRLTPLRLFSTLPVRPPFSGSISSIKRDVKKKVLPRPEAEKILSRDPAHFTVRVPLDFARGLASELSSIPVVFIVRR